MITAVRPRRLGQAERPESWEVEPVLEGRAIAPQSGETWPQTYGLGHNGGTANNEVWWPMEARESAAEEEGEHGQQEGEEWAEVEEADVARVRLAPKGPTKKEREEHDATHMPYRSWCKHCVRGRAPNNPHRARSEEEDEEKKAAQVPKIAMDYFFMGQEEDRATEYPMIVMLDETTGHRYMRAVGKKGLGDGREMEWLIKDMHEELKAWGHSGGAGSNLIFKSDGEPSIRAVRDALGRYHGGRVTPEQPPPGESQANGRVEEAGKTVRGYVRVFKDMLESKAGQKIPTDAVILQWLVRWAAMLHSRYRVGADGKTAYERQRGRKCKQEVVPFGEKVYYRKLDQDGKKLESDWEQGVWLGHARVSNEVLIGTRNGVVRAWAIKRVPEEERWSADEILNICGTPARPNPQMPGNDVPLHIHLPVEEVSGLPEEPKPARAETEPRRTYLKAKDFVKHGYTDGCEGCRRLRAGGMAARPHTEACRTRLESILREEENPRYQRYKERADEVVWEEVQRQESQRHQAGAPVQGQASSSSREGGGVDARSDGGGGGAGQHEEDREASLGRQEGRSDQEAVDDAPMNAEEEPGVRAGKRSQEAPEDDRAQADKRAKAEETQGVKREGDDTAEERQTAMRRRLQEDEEMDPMNTEMVQSLMRVDVAEMYSPARVTEEAKRFKLQAGEAMDLTTGWDFRLQKHRDRAIRYIEEEQPKLLIGSPMSTLFSQLQKLTPWTGQKQQRLEEHQEHVRFLVMLYRKQVEGGRYFLHEHPAHATSWHMADIAALRGQPGTHTVVGDKCMYGLTTESSRGRKLAAAKKSTRFMTNSYHIAREVSRRCDGVHKHQPLLDGRAQAVQRFPAELCRAICRGLINEERRKVERVSAVAEVKPGVWPQGPPNPKEHHEDLEEEIRRLTDQGSDMAYDDVTGMPLNRRKVEAARREEIQYVRDKKVWTKIPRAEAQRQGYKIIKTRWIDINKGDDENPVYRSRFVAKEFNTGEVAGLFAGTPPLEAVRYLVHEAATWQGEEKIIMINDVARAFFEAAALRKVCIELPEEDKSPSDQAKDLVGLLRMSLYGTRDAAKNWQEEVARMMKAWGFVQGQYNPCLYYHPQWGLRTLVHGDDFITVGSRDSAKKFRDALEKRFKIKTQLVGAGGGEEQGEARVLNRILRVTPQGWEYEPDPRHIDLLIDGLGLKEAKAVSTPGEDDRKWEEEENAKDLPAGQAKIFRGHAARLNYLSTDRPDIAYSTKEVCRAMATPTVGAWKKLKRLVRYLLGTRRTVLMYPWQGAELDIEAYSDSDWAGCRKTGKSTSGGALLIGEHYIKGWSSTQASITLSSAEAELVAMTKAIAETIGVSNMVKDLGHHLKGVVYADSSAALAIANRKGSGKLRHINIRMLWIQEKERKEEVETRKVQGLLNPADLMTKYLAGPRGVDLMRRVGQERREGRAQAALEIQGQGLRRVSARACARAPRGRRELRARSGGGGRERDDEESQSDDTHASMPELVPVPRRHMGGKFV